MGSKQKRRLARAQAEHARLNAVSRQRNQFRQDLSETTHKLVQSEAKALLLARELDDARCRLRDAQAAEPPPIIVHTADFFRVLMTLPVTREDTPQNRSTMPNQQTNLVLASPAYVVNGQLDRVTQGRTTEVCFDRVPVTYQTGDNRLHHALGWRIPTGVVLVDMGTQRRQP